MCDAIYCKQEHHKKYRCNGFVKILKCKKKQLMIDLFSDAQSHRDEWNRLKPFFDEIMASKNKNIIIVSHGDL